MTTNRTLLSCFRVIRGGRPPTGATQRDAIKKKYRIDGRLFYETRVTLRGQSLNKYRLIVTIISTEHDHEYSVLYSRLQQL